MAWLQDADLFYFAKATQKRGMHRSHETSLKLSKFQLFLSNVLIILQQPSVR